MPNRPIRIANTVKAAHLILTGYGHWLPNDPRGSGSTEIRKLGLAEFGPIHFGRKRVQPVRADLKAFYRHAEPALEHPTIWFDESSRNVVGGAIGEAVRINEYTVWACAVLRNHLHLVVRTHRDDSLTMLTKIAEVTHDVLHTLSLVPDGHRVWADRPYKVYLRTRDEIVGRIRYVEENPVKERLSAQRWTFVTPFA